LKVTKNKICLKLQPSIQNLFDTNLILMNLYKARIKNMRGNAMTYEAKYLTELINQLDAPKNIKKLFDIQQKQAELGGGFYGLIPDPIKGLEQIPIPSTSTNFAGLVSYLLSIRDEQRRTIADMGFPVSFSGENYVPKEVKHYSRIKISLELSTIRHVLEFFAKENPTLNEARKIANGEIFTEMVKHRNSLGYVPGPVFTTEFLTQFLFLGAVKEPIYKIWRWLSPWNFFDFADIAYNRADYERILNELEKNRENIEMRISSKIEKYVPENFEFKEHFVFSVGWAIRGWATGKYGGINIEHIKDDYDFLLDTIAHETFHRIQAMLYPGNEGKEFKIFEKPLKDKAMDALYRAMTYVFLEGTATYIQKGGFLEENLPGVQKGVALFKELYKTVFQYKKYEKLEELLNRGLRSNGPFYVLGHYMAHVIDKKFGNRAIANCLEKGSPEFFRLFIATTEGKIFSKETLAAFQKIEIAS